MRRRRKVSISKGLANTWADLAGETFVTRTGGTASRACKHIVERLAGV